MRKLDCRRQANSCVNAVIPKLVLPFGTQKTVDSAARACRRQNQQTNEGASSSSPCEAAHRVLSCCKIVYAPNSEPEAPHATTSLLGQMRRRRPRGVSATTTLGFMRLTLGADLAGMPHSASRARTFHILTKQPHCSPRDRD